jgi:DNA-binding XRE family transcriptional regulator
MEFMSNTVILAIILIATLSVFVYLLILIIRALKKYIQSKEAREEKSRIAKSLGEVLKQHRIECRMTQEFVAEALGVSRQAVSKWESGASDPSTTNLMALSKLFGVEAEDLLEETK